MNSLSLRGYAGLRNIGRESDAKRSIKRFFSRKPLEVEKNDASKLQSMDIVINDSIVDDVSAFKRVSNAHRGRRERSDSVTAEIFRERLLHQKRAESFVIDDVSVASLEALGLGMKRKKHIVYSHFTSTAAGTLHIN